MVYSAKVQRDAVAGRLEFATANMGRQNVLLKIYVMKDRVKRLGELIHTRPLHVNFKVCSPVLRRMRLAQRARDGWPRGSAPPR